MSALAAPVLALPLRLAAAAAAIALTGNLFWHGAQPYAVNAVPNGWDKLAHFGFHGLLAVLFWLALGARRWPAVLLCAAVALADEAVQSTLPGRSASAADALASVAGAAFAVGTLSALWRRRAQARRGGDDEPAHQGP